VAEKKIPLLTEVYQPRPSADGDFKSSDALLITPELIARIAAHIKPRLEADIAKTVTESVREVLKKELHEELQNDVIATQAAIEARTVDFVDRTKADLKTELPNMYQASADLVLNTLSEKLSAMQTQSISQFDTTLSDMLQTNIHAANGQIGAQVDALKTDVNACNL
jgi:hypothetical protein